MELRLIRKELTATATIGRLYADGHYLCDTLEPRTIDWAREKKVRGKTAIPCGTYAVELRHSPRFNRPMPYLADVPHFEGVMLHTGNFVADTQGCILVGTRRYRLVAGLSDSRAAFGRLWALLQEAWRTGAPVTLEVTLFGTGPVR